MCTGCEPFKMNGKPMECRKRNTVYETKCKGCEQGDRKRFVYVGESARSSRERVGEHLSDKEKQSEKSHVEALYVGPWR